MVERERDREREREREREKMQMSLDLWSSRLVFEAVNTKLGEYYRCA
jgi:hypothetical protein